MSSICTHSKRHLFLHGQIYITASLHFSVTRDQQHFHSKEITGSQQVMCNIFILCLFFAVMNYVSQGGGVSLQLPLVLLEIKMGERNIENCSLLGGTEDKSV